MPFCPTCGAAYRTSLPECPACHVELDETPPEPSPLSAKPKWVTVYQGVGVQLRSIEERLRAQGFSVTQLHGHSAEMVPLPLHLGHEAVLYKLMLPEDEYLSREAEVRALVAAGGVTAEDADAIREAEEDYDVRGCPQCVLYFHEQYAACPGCETALVPAVECFADGQAEPDRVIVGHGTEAAVKALETRLREAGFDAQSFEVEGWTVDVVDLPWVELIDRTTVAKDILGLRE